VLATVVVHEHIPLADGAGPNETLLSIEKARRVLGYEPGNGWR
jgi:hypothetical protein